MRQIVITAFISLDGVMQAPGGPEEDPADGFEAGGWTAPYWDGAGAAEMGAFLDETFSQPFDLLLGRRTYEIFAAHWPHVGADDPMGALFDRVTKHVAAGPDTPLDWANSLPLGPDVVAAVRRLKAGTGPDLLIQGSSVLVQALIANDLIDTFRLLVFPLVLGRGKRLFGEGTVPAALRLTAGRTAANGVVMGVYERAGAVTTGSFALEPPPEAERARRARLGMES